MERAYPLFGKWGRSDRTVITSDNKVVLTKRKMTTGVWSGEWDVSVVEAIDPISDRSSTQSGPDVIQSIVRGVDQEVGINVEPEDVHILGLALDTKYYQWNIFAKNPIKRLFN